MPIFRVEDLLSICVGRESVSRFVFRFVGDDKKMIQYIVSSSPRGSAPIPTNTISFNIVHHAILLFATPSCAVYLPTVRAGNILCPYNHMEYECGAAFYCLYATRHLDNSYSSLIEWRRSYRFSCSRSCPWNL